MSNDPTPPTTKSSTFDDMLDLGCYFEERGYRGAVGCEGGIYQFVIYRDQPTPDLTHWKDIPITYEHTDAEAPFAF